MLNLGYCNNHNILHQAMKKIITSFCLFLFVSNYTLSQVNLEDGLELYLNFESGIEEFIHGNEVIQHGNIQIVSDSNCFNGNSLQINGADSFLELTGTEGINPEGDFCFSLWVKKPEEQQVFTSGANSIISKWIEDDGHHHDQGYPFTLRTTNSSNPENGKYRIALFEGFDNPCDEANVIISNEQYNDDNFHHILFGLNGDKIKLFVDCAQVAEIDYTLDCPIENEAKIFIGARNETFLFNRPNNFTGQVDEIRYYHRFINPDELDILCSCECLEIKEELISEIICHDSSIEINDILYNSEGNYIQNLTTSNGCDSILSIQIIVEPQIVNYETYQICKGDSILINNEIFNSEGNYTQMYINDNGCTEFLNITIEIETIEINENCQSESTTTQDLKIFFPQIFTPDGDDNNDYWGLYSGQDLMISEFKIYDRWGEMIYSVSNIMSSNENHRWDGRFNGVKVNPGVYVYYMKLGEPFNKLVTGDLTLLR